MKCPKCRCELFREIQYVQQAQEYDPATMKYGEFEHLDAEVRAVQLLCADCGEVSEAA